MEEYIPLFDSYVPFFQTLAWIVLILVGGFVFRGSLSGVLGAVQHRVQTGSSLKAGPVELGEDLRALPEVAPASPMRASSAPVSSIEGSWNEERDDLYKENRDVFLAHVLEPAEVSGQHYKAFIYLIRHRDAPLDDVEYAEFFLGPYWRNQVFRETLRDGKIGIATSAYGTFLCVCHVHFHDGHIAKLHRYIDFEMGRAFKARKK